MKKELFIFLDIDGVLNKELDWIHPFTINNENLKVFCSLCSKLQKNKHISIVLISSWRTAGDIPDLIKLRETLSGRGIKIIGSTPATDKGRQAEVEYFIKRNGIKDYIIIDDDISLYDTPEHINIYVPNYRKGLTNSDIKAICKKMR